MRNDIYVVRKYILVFIFTAKSSHQTGTEPLEDNYICPQLMPVQIAT